MKKMTEKFIVEKIKEYLLNKENSNWIEDKTIISSLHGHGADLIMVGGSNKGERFIIECKGKSYAKSHNSINKECWLNALGQLITRMNSSRILKYKGETNKAYKYGLGLCEISASVALRRIPYEIAKTLNLYIFSCNDEGKIKMYTPSDFKEI